MACLSVTYKRHGDGLKATFSLVCNNSVGENRLYTVDNDFLLTAEIEYLTVNKQD